MNHNEPINDKDMTKADIVSRISEQTGIEKEIVTSVVEGFMEQLRDSLIGGENVYLRGFCTFLLKHRAAKTARNISKNTTMIVPAHTIQAFKPSKAFAAKVK